MKNAIVSIALVALVWESRVPRAADDLLARMAALNPNLHTFTAAMHAHVALKTFPFLSVDLAGTYYHKEPDQNKVVFTSGVPAVAASSTSSTRTSSARALARRLYGNGRFRRRHDDDVQARAAQARQRRPHRRSSQRQDATVDSMRWNYDNGGYAEMNSRYGEIDGNLVVTSQTGHVDEPGYKADITSTIDNYKINAPLSDCVFASQ